MEMLTISFEMFRYAPVVTYQYKWEQWLCWKGWRCPIGNDIPAKNFILKKLSEIFHDIESMKDEMLDGNPYLERRMTIQQTIEKMLIPNIQIIREESKHC